MKVAQESQPGKWINIKVDQYQHTLLVIAGGTGGHVFPGLAVAQHMRALGWRVVWLGNASGMEATLVPKYDIPIEYVRFGGLRGKGMRVKLALPINLLCACWQSLRVLRRIKPDVVLGLGGYIAFPAGLMAALTRRRRRRLVIHEQNSIAGFTNRLLAHIARRVLVAFPAALPGAEWVGNPLRAQFIAQPHPRERFAARSGRLKLLVIGGSLGAAALNEIVPRALALLAPDERPSVLHQAGVKQLETLRANYAKAGIHLTEMTNEVTNTTNTAVQVTPFIDDMAAAYAQADAVVCRCGAMTVAEITAVGVAALLVPFPFAVDDHQTANAAFLVKHRAATMIQQSELSAQKLADWMKHLTRAALVEMASHARALAKPDATARVAQICASVVE